MQPLLGRDATTLLDSAFNNAPMAFYISAAVNGCAIAYLSPNIEKMLGFPPRAFLTSPLFWREHIHPEEAEYVLRGYGCIAEAGHQILEYRFLDAQGAYRWLRDEIYLVHPGDGAPDYVQGYWHDISEQKQREAALLDAQHTLLQKNNVLQSILDSLPQRLLWKDRDSVFLGCNRAAACAIGLAQTNEIVGKADVDLYADSMEAEYLRVSDEAVMVAGHAIYHANMPAKQEGVWRDVTKVPLHNESGDVSGLLISYEDVSKLKLVEDELRQSEERFRTIANYTYNWENWIAPNGKLLWVNSAVERISGYTPEECYAMPDYPVRLIHPDDLPMVLKHFGETLAGAAHRDLECRILRKDGAIRWAEIAVQQVCDANGNPLGHRSSLRDVTDRRQVMDQLHDTRDRLQFVLDHIPQGVFWKDLKGAYLGGNAIFVHDLGMSEGWDKKGLTDYDIFPTGEASKFWHDDQIVMLNNKTLSRVEEQFTDSNGIKHWIITSKVPLHNRTGEVLGLLGTYTDHTELKQLDEELRDNELRLREITTTVAEGIYMVVANGTLSFINHEAEKLLGWHARDLLGKSDHSVFHACGKTKSAHRHCSNDTCSILGTTKNGKPFASDDEIFVRKDGTPFNVSIRATPFMRNGEYAGSVVAFHDITEQKITQRHLHETLQELQSVNASLEQRVSEQTQQNIEKERLLIQQSRSAAMGEMISNIAHQWRQPLSTLGLVVQNILLDYRENQLNLKELEKYVDTAQQCVMRMSETIDDFRDFFRPDKARELLSLHQVIEESLHLMEATLKNHNIQVALSEDRGLQAFGHFNEFSQVILNLLANAKEALLVNKVHHARIEVELKTANHTRMVVIRDNAGGIPQNAMAKIFDPYFTTKVGGTGIGLYMSKTIIEKHMGGSISCRNTADGAEFTVSIPLGTKDDTQPE